MAELNTDTRNRLKSTQFGLPGSRKYPMPDRSHAGQAKARATQMVKKGKLSAASAAKIRAKANRKLGKSNTGVNADLNAPGNRSPQTPLQEDQNSWKSRPSTERTKWMNNSQGTGKAADSGQGQSYKRQAKFGGTQVPVASKKGQVKVSSGATSEPGINYKKQAKFGGTGNPAGGNGKRYANGSSSLDSMKSMVRDH